ncbi:MAG TPA: hypothetical protein VGL14_02765 [Methylomirabilota bacterium]|jgi:hypothetical protein
MRKVISLRLLVCLVGTLVLAATAVIGASLTDSAVTEKSATADGKLDARSTEASLGEARPPVNIDPLTASADDHAASTVGDSGETSTLDSAMGGGPIDVNITPIDAGVLDGAATVARYGPDPDLTMVNTETGDATGLAPIATDASQVGVTSDSGGAGGDGVPSMGSATGLPLAGGPETSGGDTGSAAPVPELATFFLVVFPVLAGLIVRLRG